MPVMQGKRMTLFIVVIVNYKNIFPSEAIYHPDGWFYQ